MSSLTENEIQTSVQEDHHNLGKSNSLGTTPVFGSVKRRQLPAIPIPSNLEKVSENGNGKYVWYESWSGVVVG